MKAPRTLLNRLFSVKALALAAFLAAPALAQEDPYAVSGVEVRAQAANPLQAKEAAIAEGQLEALRRLGRQRGVPEDRLAALTAAQAAGAASGYQVLSERTGANTYHAIIRVTFDPGQCQALLGDAGFQPAPQAAALPGRVALLPLLRTDSAWLLWEDTNYWKSALQAQFDVMPPPETSLASGNLEEASLLDGEAAATADKLKLAAFKTATGADRLVIAEAELLGGSLSVRTYSTPDMMELLAPRQFPADALQEAAAYVLQGLSGLKVVPVTDYPEPAPGGVLPTPATAAGFQAESLRVSALVGGLDRLPALRQRLRQIPGISQVMVEAVAHDQADLLLTLTEPVENIRALLEAQGMQLTQEQGYWVLR